jgi:DNA-binding MarR family transcriptional regulator
VAIGVIPARAQRLVRRSRGGGDRRKILVELTDRAVEEAESLYGPLVAEGAGVLARFTDRELSLLRDYLRAATELTERHEKRIADGATH